MITSYVPRPQGEKVGPLDFLASLLDDEEAANEKKPESEKDNSFDKWLVDTLEKTKAKAEAAEKPKKEAVNHPDHYNVGGIETIDFIEAKGLDFCLGNVVKYITRADHKGNKLQDLKKARWYLDHEIQALEK